MLYYFILQAGDKMKKQLQVRIYPDGKIDARTLGVKGEKCTDYIKTFEQLLNAQVIESAYTDEYYQTRTQQVSEVIQKSNK